MKEMKPHDGNNAQVEYERKIRSFTRVALDLGIVTNFGVEMQLEKQKIFTHSRSWMGRAMSAEG